ncbi:MAG: endonuclease Q family protein [Candidatus Asgardarchaeia archaeon]
MNLKNISRYAKIKGINIVGTGDILHPEWLKQVRTSTHQVSDGLYSLQQDQDNVVFILSTEVNLSFKYEQKSKNIHHVLLIPNFEVVEQLYDVLSNYGDLVVDGRPTLYLSPPGFIELIMSVSHDIFVIPAHIFTPWYSLFGAFSGFNSLKDCYQDKAHYIKVVETGLSSDPPMNYKLSQLDSLLLVSNSDAHSPYPWRLGREANILQIKKLSYKSILEALIPNASSTNKLVGTIEVPPELGKYHWSGHRACGVSFPPEKSLEMNDICPVCGKKMTIGVSERVELLSDKKEISLKNKPAYYHLVPFHDILKSLYGFSSYYSKQLWEAYYSYVKLFGNEYQLTLFSPESELKEKLPPKIAKIVLMMRHHKLTLIPGYDGVYGQLKLDFTSEGDVASSDRDIKLRELEKTISRMSVQSTLNDYF